MHLKLAVVVATQICVVWCLSVPTNLRIARGDVTPESAINTSTSPGLKHTQPSSSLSSSSSSHSIWKPLYLPVTSSQPDPLGIAQVSGFYGPGAWAAWFITGVASWLRIFRRTKDKVDVNTVLFLLGTNWAAVDMLKSIHMLGNLQPNEPEYLVNVEKSMGTYGASFNVAFWGSIHIILQVPATWILFEDMKSRRRRRIFILVVGALLPLIALTANGFGPSLYQIIDYFYLSYPQVGLDSMPALYSKGMALKTHRFMMLLGSHLVLLFIVPLSLLTLWEAAMIGEWTWGLKICLRAIGLLNLAFFILMLAASWLGFWACYPFACLVMIQAIVGLRFTYGIAAFWAFSVIIYCLIYVREAYFHSGSLASESCFFMPCASQTLSDEDQLFGLFAGLTTFAGFEILPPLWAHYKVRHQFVEEWEEKARRFRLRLTHRD
ncbi:hypothetical protein BT63DRAFT_235609 [Microthyrium microscopicum]|uniref:Uncharacterized protein n=1 Tax=Microthyrium microscopicum TaxID=703497 RepID=A0A6A6UDG6_9PEZI|nr:hypothetical protein BT63DRAFT_235609 [Microthyrium microscopicum]